MEEDNPFEVQPTEVYPQYSNYLLEDVGKLAYWLESIGILATEDIHEKSLVAEKESLYLRLKDGVALCKLLQYIRPNSLTKFNLTVASKFAAIDNIRLFLMGCERNLNLDHRLLFDPSQEKNNFDRVLS